MNDEIIPLEDDIYEEEIEVEEETAVMNAMWGNISGNIENQTDLQQALDAKQDNLTQAQLDAANSGITSAKVATYDGYPAQITSAVSSEADIRRQADTTLQGNIDAEERARKAADKDIQDVLDGETLARQNADTALGGRIDTEIHDRQVADNGLQSQIDAITSKSDVVDVVANYAALQAYDTSTLGNNDVVKVLDDETHGDAMTYYRWSTTTQTWSYIGQEAPYYTKSQTDTLLLDKQDKIDATHKLSADLVDDTSTTNKFVTALDKTNWNAKQDALTAGNNIDITGTTISTPAIAPEVVAELPTIGAEGKLYLAPKNYTRGTGTGNPIEATITDEAGKMESFKLDGDTFQQTYSGKNLLACADEEITRAGIDITWRAGKATLSGKCTSTQVFITDYCKNNLAAGTYTFSMGGEEAPHRFIFRTFDASNQTIASYTLEQGDTSVGVTISGTEAKYRIVMLGVVDNTYDETDYFQLEAGLTATSFEPYVGGVPSPNPDYPQPIQTVTGEQTITVLGKNLISANWESGRYNNSTGVKEPFSDNVRTDAPISVQPSKTYICSRNGSGLAMNILQYKADGSFISATTISSGNSFTTGAETYFVTMFRGTSGGTEGIQLELGSTITSYAPYQATSYPISLGSIELCKLGTYQDYIYKDGNDWKVHKATESTRLDLMSWSNETAGGGYGRRYRSQTLVNVIYSIASTSAIADMDCSHYTIGNMNDTWSGGGQVVALHTNKSVYIYDYRFKDEQTTTQLDSWLNTAKPSLYFPLATPTDTVITDQTLIAQLEAIRTASLENGTNTITNTATGSNLAGDMEIGYYGYNPTNRYDKFIWLDLNNNYEQIGS